MASAVTAVTGGKPANSKKTSNKKKEAGKPAQVFFRLTTPVGAHGCHDAQHQQHHGHGRGKLAVKHKRHANHQKNGANHQKDAIKPLQQADAGDMTGTTMAT